ncbi:hypothetical protein DACRYDRAFT_23634 [Dacryopinax primogenitus]|uniref:Protein CPL1-like domain-containing protein n=1 Tax=Dacryopinax primogenitus (strain DJM 731) TaxID=1858805 RepID=M5FV72_DACPD|nr:uncharacterized protein DACRYDRAFT_23634 [Dacryopinax primogenitus]EJT99504.1 hypothetical protein DACRYDRAFT_23634 [Dacryopinax primogenitus]
MYTVRSFLTFALVLLTVSLPALADHSCQHANNCPTLLIGSNPGCHNSLCYYESCSNDAGLGYKITTDCYTTGGTTRCRCKSLLTGSNYRKRRDLETCPLPQQQRCPVFHGRGGTECVDVMTDIESCGGCVGVDGEGDGVDCTDIVGAESVSCISGSCFIDECAHGYRLDKRQSSCIPITGMRVQKNNSQKRNFRV